MTDNPYDRAAALWVASKTGLKADGITNVTFATLGSACETCGYDASGVRFDYAGHWRDYEFPSDVKVADFLSEAIALLAEGAGDNSVS